MHLPKPLILLILALAACGGTPNPLEDGGFAGGSGGGSGGGGATGGGTGGSGGCGPTIDFTKDPMNCGACGTVCQFPNAVASCTATRCGIKSCAAGFRNLDGDATNGCEAACTPMNVSASGNLDFNLSVIQLSGKVTRGGQPLPLSSSRGTLTFALSGSKGLTVELPATGEATYATKLFAGQYRVSLFRDSVTRLVYVGPITASGVLDFDAVASTDGGISGPNITIAGTITANGAMLAAGGRGKVTFESDVGSATAVLPTSGPGSYLVTLVPGIYTVSIEGEASCTVLPCFKSARKKKLSLTTTGNLDFDLPIVQVSGAVTANGQPLAGAASERGQLALWNAAGEGPTLSLGSTGNAQWSTLLYAGSYDVVVSNMACAASSPLPCQRRKAKTAVPLNTAGVLDVDLKVLDISGQVLANGSALGPSSFGGNRGTLSFVNAGSGPTVSLGTSGAATFQVKLYEGSYDLSVSNGADCPIGPLPCGSKKVKTISLSTSGVLDVDVPVVRVSGVLTLNGTTVPNAPSARGKISLSGPSNVSIPLAANGPASWAATLHPGTYRIELNNDVDCEVGPVPCQKRALDTARALTVDGALTHDLSVVDITGAVTLNGQAVSAASSQVRGEVLFKDPTYGTVASSLGSSCNTTYRARLYPSSYQVLFRNTKDCAPTDSQPLPCQGEAEVEASAALTASGSRDFNLQAVTLSGVIQVNGAPMAATTSGQARGVMRFATFGASPASRPLTSSGVANYQVRLLPGQYDVGIENQFDCNATSALPCQQQVLAGCRPP